jgi:hypothetical protein
MNRECCRDDEEHGTRRSDQIELPRRCPLPGRLLGATAPGPCNGNGDGPYRQRGEARTQHVRCGEPKPNQDQRRENQANGRSDGHEPRPLGDPQGTGECAKENQPPGHFDGAARDKHQTGRENRHRRADQR